MENENAPEGATPPPLARGYYRDPMSNLVFFITQNGDRIELTTEDAVQRLNSLLESSERFEARWHEANSTITDYSDWRLEEMWQKAGQIADRAGHCSVYDDLVRELGGIPRQRDYTVSIPVNGYVHVVVTASSSEEAEEFARDIADADDAQDLALDWYNASIEQD